MYYPKMPQTKDMKMLMLLDLNQRQLLKVVCRISSYLKKWYNHSKEVEWMWEANSVKHQYWMWILQLLWFHHSELFKHYNMVLIIELLGLYYMCLPWLWQMMEMSSQKWLDQNRHHTFREACRIKNDLEQYFSHSMDSKMKVGYLVKHWFWK